MQRDYSKAWEDRLVTLATNEQKDEKSGNIFSRAISAAEDAVVSFTISVGLMRADDALFDFNGDVASYQTCVIDAQNIKASEIRRIFQDCRSACDSNGEDISAAGGELDTIVSSLIQLTEAIDPTMSQLTPGSLSQLKNDIGEQMETIRSDSKQRLDRNFTKVETLQAKKATKELIVDVFDCVVDVCSFTVDVASGNWISAGLDVYDMVNDFTGLCNDAGALGAIGYSHLLSASDKDYSTLRLQILEDAERMRQTDDLSDALHNAAQDLGDTKVGGFFDGLGTVLDYADGVKGVYELGTAVKGAGDKLGDDGVLGLINPLTSGYDEAEAASKLKDVNKQIRQAKKLDEGADKAKLLKKLGEEKDTLKRLKKVRQFKDTKAAAKNTKLFFEIAEGASEGELWETVFGKTPIGGIFPKGKSTAEGVETMAEIEAKHVMPGVVRSPEDAIPCVLY